MGKNKIKKGPDIVFASESGGCRRRPPLTRRTDGKKHNHRTRDIQYITRKKRSFDLISYPDKQNPVEKLDEEILKLRHRIVSFSANRLRAFDEEAQGGADSPEIKEGLEALGYK